MKSNTIYGVDVQNLLIEYLAGLSDLERKEDGSKEWWLTTGCVKKGATIEIIDPDKQKFIIRSYYKNGRVRFKAYYLDCLRHGVYKSYYDNGKINEKGRYYCGLRDGNWVIKDKSGRYKRNKIYINGKLKKVITDKKEYIYVGKNLIVRDIK